MNSQLDFDHVAIAVRDHREALAALTGELGGSLFSGGWPPGSGFRALQVRLGSGEDGMTVEVLEPADVDQNDFLERFLIAGGDGPHHVTFKTDDIEAELDRIRGLGIEPVAINFSYAFWQEMFIHPRDSHGTVVQIAQTDAVYPSMSEWLAGLPETLEVYDGQAWWDDSVLGTASEPDELRRVVIETPNRTMGDDFYSRILGSSAEVRAGWTEHAWTGGVIRLVDAAVDRPRVSRLEVARRGVDSVIAGTRFISESE